MKRRIMIALHEIKEETEAGAYAIDMANEMKARGYEPWIFANVIMESPITQRAHEGNIKTTDNLHLGIHSLHGEFEAYVAMDEWAKENVPMNIEPKKMITSDMKKSAAEVASIVIDKIKKEPKLKDK